MKVADYYRRILSQPVGAVVHDLLPEGVTRETSSRIECDCPRHNSKSKAAVVVAAETGLWKCHGCGVGGDLLQLHEFVTCGVVSKGHGAAANPSHREARDWLAGRVGLPPLEQALGEPDQVAEQLAAREEEQRALRALTEACELWRTNLLADDEALAFVEETWGFNREVVEDYLLGYARPGTADYEELVERAEAAGQPVEETRSALLSTGAFVHEGDAFFPWPAGRITFPFIRGGLVVQVVARRTPRTPPGKCADSKYLKLIGRDPKAAAGTLKADISPAIVSDALWNEDALLPRPDRVVLCEGVADAIAVTCTGVKGLAASSTAPSADALQRIASALAGATTRVVVFGDAELSGAGLGGALKTAAALEELGVATAIATSPPGEAHRAALDDLEAMLGLRDAVDRIEELPPPERRAELHRTLAALSAADAERAGELVAAAKTDPASWLREAEDGPAALEEVFVTARPRGVVMATLVQVQRSAGAPAQIDACRAALEAIRTAPPADREAGLTALHATLKERCDQPVTLTALTKECTALAKKAKRTREESRRGGESSTGSASGAPSMPGGGRKRVEIFLTGGELHESVSKAEDAVMQTGAALLFQRGSLLVRPARLAEKVSKKGIRLAEGTVVLQALDVHGLCEIFNRAARFSKETDRDTEVIDCPERLAKWYAARAGRWRVPVLTGLLLAPTMLVDGRILAKEGYDATSGLYLDCGGTTFPPIPDEPTRDEGEEALALLVDLLREFRFATLVDRAVVLAAILTALARNAFPLAPGFAFNAPSMSSGKGLLARIVASLATGHPAPAMSQGKDEEEDRKRVLALLVEGTPVALVDNIERDLRGDAICSAITEEVYCGRLLGRTQMVRVPTTGTTWLFTGNGLTIRGDMRTRVMVANLDPGCERPWERRFERNLEQHVDEHRGELVTAALTALRAYVVAGRPELDLVPCRFPAWSRLVRSALVWVGEADPIESMRKLEARDPEAQMLAALVDAWWDAQHDEPLTVKDVIKAADEGEQEALIDAMKAVVLGRDGKPDARRLGKYLSKCENRISGGRRFERAGTRARATLWRLVEVEQAQDPQPEPRESEFGEFGGEFAKGQTHSPGETKIGPDDPEKAGPDAASEFRESVSNLTRAREKNDAGGEDEINLCAYRGAGTDSQHSPNSLPPPGEPSASTPPRRDVGRHPKGVEPATSGEVAAAGPAPGAVGSNGSGDAGVSSNGAVDPIPTRAERKTAQERRGAEVDDA